MTSEIEDEDFQPVELNGRENLPAIGQRCLFQLRMWTDRPVRDFRCYGYRDDVNSIYIPLYKTRLSILCLKGWIAQRGAAFCNGKI